MTHICPGKGCTTEVPDDMVACRVHWFALPYTLRREIWQVWDHGRGKGSAAHAYLIRCAVAWLQR